VFANNWYTSVNFFNIYQNVDFK